MGTPPLQSCLTYAGELTRASSLWCTWCATTLTFPADPDMLDCAADPDMLDCAGELVIDGKTLEHVLGTNLEQSLALLGSHCEAVVICRASPSQKAAIVKMMTKFEVSSVSRTMARCSALLSHEPPVDGRDRFGQVSALGHTAVGPCSVCCSIGHLGASLALRSSE